MAYFCLNPNKVLLETGSPTQRFAVFIAQEALKTTWTKTYEQVLHDQGFAGCPSPNFPKSKK